MKVCRALYILDRVYSKLRQQVIPSQSIGVASAPAVRSVDHASCTILHPV